MREPNNKVYYRSLIESYLHDYPATNILKFNDDFNQLLTRLPLYVEDFPIEGEIPSLRYNLDKDGTLNVQPKNSLQYINVTINITPNEN